MKLNINKFFTSVLIFALVMSILPAQFLVSASAPELFFSEYIEGSSNNKALEIYNGTGATIDLAAGIYDIQMYFNGSTTAGLTVALTGSVIDGDVYVLAHSSAVADVQAQADQTNGAGWFNGNDIVVLRKDGVVIDALGQIGNSANYAINTTLVRNADICAGDTDPNDVFDSSVEWTSFAQDTFTNLGSHTADCGGEPPAPAEPKINEYSANTVGSQDVEYVEVFGSPNTDYSAYTMLEIEGDSSGAGVIDEVIGIGTTDANGFWLGNLPNGALENGTITLLLVKNFSGAYGNDLDTDNDGTFDDTPWDEIVDSVAVYDGGSSDITYSPTVLAAYFDGMNYAPGGASRFPDGEDNWVRNDFDLAGIPGEIGSLGPSEALNTPGATNEIYVAPPEACGDAYTPIYAIQGSGSASDLDGSEVATEGIVVGDFQVGGKNGFFIQDAVGDGNAATSDGIFVYSTSTDVSVGDHVRVRGIVDEYYDLTEITSVSQIWTCGTGSVAPTSLSLPVNDLEPYEGMLVTFPDSLYIAEYYAFAQFGEIVLTTERQFQPTAVYEPGSPEAAQLAADNALGRITLDDGSSYSNPNPARHPNGADFFLSYADPTLNNLFRGGDTLQNVTGVLDFNFGAYKIQPTQGADYANANPRTAQPDDVGGNLKVASFNVLNYFTTLDDGTNDICGPNFDLECRGADTVEEFERQRAKIVAALAAIDADVVGLIEIENNEYEAVADLVAGLNDKVGAGTYGYVDTGYIGEDAIKVAFIYKTATVSLVGNFAVLDDQSFTNPLGYVDEDGNLEEKSRPALAQTFMDNGTGGVFTAVVNHLKSKGSGCGENDDDPEQGSCNLTRELGAQALVDWLASDPTGSGDADFLIIGDLNAYDKEDPIKALISGGYTDLVKKYQGEYAYSYVFDGQLGYLDHALAIDGLLDEVTGVTVWHINSDEPSLIDYDMSYKKDAQDALYAPDAYRSSDHDPVIIGLNVCDEIAPTFDELSVSPDNLWPANHKYVDVTATVVVSDNFDPNPTVTLVSVTSSEADNGLGDGDTANDIVIVNDFTFQLRAERSGVNGEGRTYTLTYRVTDACGNFTEQSISVFVPFSQKK